MLSSVQGVKKQTNGKSFLNRKMFGNTGKVVPVKLKSFRKSKRGACILNGKFKITCPKIGYCCINS